MVVNLGYRLKMANLIIPDCHCLHARGSNSATLRETDGQIVSLCAACQFDVDDDIIVEISDYETRCSGLQNVDCPFRKCKRYSKYLLIKGGIYCQNCYYIKHPINMSIFAKTDPVIARNYCEKRNGDCVIYFGGSSPLSNFFRARIVDSDGVVFASSEQMYQYYKARFAGDLSVQKYVMATRDPFIAKMLGSGVRNLNKEVWESEKIRVMREAVALKFGQNPELKNYLKAIRTVIGEASYDRVWGIGFSMTHANAMIPNEWRSNLMGGLLMTLRDKLLNM